MLNNFENDVREERRIQRLRFQNMQRAEQLKADEKVRLQRVLDRDGLEEQLEEKRKQKQVERAEEFAYEEFEKKSNEILREQEVYENVRKKMEAKDLAQKWKEQEIEQKIKQQKVQTFTPQDYGICAAQKFAGEDEEFETRLALRAKLTAESIETQKNEILQKKQNEKLENLRYAQYEKYTATQRILLAQREAENERLKNIDLMKVNLQNANLRNQRQKQTCQEIKELEKMEILYKKNDPLLCETGIHDFKGFSRKDWQSSFDINQNLIQAKKQQQQQQKYEELSFHQTQSQLAQYEQNFEQQRIKARRQASLRLAQEYSQQAQLEAQRRRQKKIDSFGSISLDSGYLAGFGTSGR